jgi:hypothetical protein
MGRQENRWAPSTNYIGDLVSLFTPVSMDFFRDEIDNGVPVIICQCRSSSLLRSVFGEITLLLAPRVTQFAALCTEIMHVCRFHCSQLNALSIHWPTILLVPQFLFNFANTLGPYIGHPIAVQQRNDQSEHSNGASNCIINPLRLLLQE